MRDCLIGIEIDPSKHQLITQIELPRTSSWDGPEARFRLGPPTESGARPNDALVKLIARAFQARDTLLGLNQNGVAEMPIRNRRHLERTAKLSYLAPDIVLAILDGRQPSHLSARKLVRAASLPLDWGAQRQMLLAS